jgi:hypothetical protein
MVKWRGSGSVFMVFGGGRDLLRRSVSCHRDWVVWIQEEVSYIQVFDISDPSKPH